MPGEPIQVRVAVDPALAPTGKIHKTVWVFIKGQASPAATLAMTGTILPAAAFDPPGIDFGKVNAGSRLTQLLTVTVDTSALPAGTAWSLASSNPDVQIAPTRAAKPSASSAAGETRSFQAILSPKARLGMVEGNVSVVFDTPGAPETASSSVPVIGLVAGDITAQPATLAFGLVTAGQHAERQTFVTGKTAGTLTVSSPDPHVSGKLVPQPTAGDAKDSKTLVLIATLSADTPPGPVQTCLLVTTPRGQQLQIPVYAVVTPPANRKASR
jgi:hypothetical protein